MSNPGTNQRLVLMSTEQVLRGVQIYIGAEGIIHLTVYANAGGVNNTCLSPKKSYLTNWKPKDNTYLKKLAYMKYKVIISNTILLLRTLIATATNGQSRKFQGLLLFQ